jgi:hypothetical protein
MVEPPTTPGLHCFSNCTPLYAGTTTKWHPLARRSSLATADGCCLPSQEVLPFEDISSNIRHLTRSLKSRNSCKVALAGGPVIVVVTFHVKQLWPGAACITGTSICARLGGDRSVKPNINGPCMPVPSRQGRYYKRGTRNTAAGRKHQEAHPCGHEFSGEPSPRDRPLTHQDTWTANFASLPQALEFAPNNWTWVFQCAPSEVGAPNRRCMRSVGMGRRRVPEGSLPSSPELPCIADTIW